LTVDRLIAEREALDAGFGGSLAMSAAAHALIAIVALLAAFLAPRQPPLKIMDGFAVPLPAGGRGVRTAQAPAPAAQPEPAPPVTAPPAPKVEEPPKVVKPPKEEAPKNRIPEADAPKTRARPQKTPPPRPQAAERGETGRAIAGAAGGTGQASATPGVEFGPAGPGVPGGTDPSGDWYLAGVQRKIWVIWNQQIRANFTQPVGVTFTILANGSVQDVRVIQSSGATLLDLAAQRAVHSAAPFAPLPKHYGTDRYTIQALFKPTP
jgi:protein TonB